MLEPTDAQIKLPEPAFVSALGLEILRLKKRKRERDLFTLREVTKPCWWMRLNALKDTFRYRAFWSLSL